MEAIMTAGMHEIQGSEERCPQCFKPLVFDIDIPRDEDDVYRMRVECWGCGFWSFR
jgi:hypothetical protein